MINYDYITKDNIEEHNLNCPVILNYPYRILIIGGSGSENPNALINLKKQQNDDG